MSGNIYSVLFFELLTKKCPQKNQFVTLFINNSTQYYIHFVNTNVDLEQINWSPYIIRDRDLIIRDRDHTNLDRDHPFRDRDL